MSNPSNPKVLFKDLAVGAEREEVVVTNLTRTQIVQYAGASGDFNPIHHDEMFATKAAGYPSVFAHGMLTMGLTGTLLTNWLGDGVLRSFGVRFVKQVFPGDTLTARGTVTSLAEENGLGRVEIELVTTNQRGEPVVTGSAVAALPL
ncbi:MAG: MaoC family dehydratase N-terminal domain-containing protein [Deltaproteobacteria bacterium]|nr:MAG: MaoC family dehydratase N-terminal domain-containing protein [Deltaproteobacteria bacterium]